MPTPIVRDSGSKPYIDPGKGQDSGYINAMRRTTQKSETDNPPRGSMKNNQRRGSISQIDDRGIVVSPAGLIVEATMAAVSWGIAFDASGGLYFTQDQGSIWYRPAGGAFGDLVQTHRAWEEISVNLVTGDVLAVDFAAGIYRRAAGAGDFTLMEAGGFTCVSCAPNDIYALKANKLWTWDGSVFVDIGQPERGYTGLTCALNGDVYATVYGTGKIYVRLGGAGDLVELAQTIVFCRTLANAPNGDIFLAAYTGFDYNVYKRARGIGNFEVFFDVARPTQCLAVSPGGVVFLSSTLDADNKLYSIGSGTTTVLPATNTIVQSHATPETRTRPMRKNLKPYANRTYEEMQQFAQPIEVTGRERVPETEGLPILIDHIPEVSRFVRNGSPIVIDIPTTAQDPVSRVEIYARVDGMASVAPNGTSVIYNPGASGTALLIIHTKSGQQCTVNLMAK